MIEAGDLTCPWPLDLDKCCDPTEVDEEIAEDVIAQVSAMMVRWSGFRIGQCEVTIRPLTECRECRGWCCGSTDGLRLFGPLGQSISDVLAVHHGPDTIPSTEWRWDRPYQTLWAVPPLRWPSRDQRWSDCGEGEAFCVDVLTGSAPDAWAIATAQTLACELIKSCLGQKCRLPRNATTVSAQGVTINLSTEEIQYLIPEVAAWVEAVNPSGAVLPTRVSSPELGPAYGGGGGCCGR